MKLKFNIELFLFIFLTLTIVTNTLTDDLLEIIARSLSGLVFLGVLCAMKYLGNKEGK